MANASCSGGTPFKQLIDHQSRDVSHHQDRLVDRSGINGHASFRSAPRHPAEGQASFGAFIDGPSPVGSLPGLPHSPASRLATHATALQQPSFMQAAPTHARVAAAPDMSNWAADFTRFTGCTQQTRALAPTAAPLAVPMAHQANYQPPFGQTLAPMYNHAGLAYMDPRSAAPLPSDFDQDLARWASVNRAGSMAQVDAAMEQMARELELNEAALPEEVAAAVEQTSETRQNDHLTDLETPELGNLTLNDPATPRLDPIAAQVDEQVLDHIPADEVGVPKGKSAVSEAAERLLESVQHEGGEKWQNSVFLSLMRDFRDGRKDIVDNEVRQMDGDVVGTGVEQQQQTPPP
ncbi:hypothetical protein RJ55_08513 [Drechmeria coniospora]|nr:hypothetical protein RJ55_08513 [Drechmeria coniospora]